jgi:hypothetical protein
MCRGSSVCVINAFAEGSEVGIIDMGRKASSLLEMRGTVGMMLNPEAQWGLYRSVRPSTSTAGRRARHFPGAYSRHPLSEKIDKDERI